MFFQILIAILMGLSHPSQSNQSCNGTTVNSTNFGLAENGEGGGGTTGGGGTGGNTGQNPPPPQP